jgi:hypothetical protein
MIRFTKDVLGSQRRELPRWGGARPAPVGRGEADPPILAPAPR